MWSGSRCSPTTASPYKSIVEPAHVTRCLSAHSFKYRDGLPVDEEMRPVDPLKCMTRKPAAWARLRIHHYFSRSEEERVRKAELWRDVGSARSVPTGAAPPSGQTVRDETLAAYAPAVREALARRAAADDLGLQLVAGPEQPRRPREHRACEHARDRQGHQR